MIWTPRTTVAALVCHQDRYLFVEEKSEDGRRVLNQPAGHLEDGESIFDAVVRETLEEAGASFTPESFVGIYRWQPPHLDLTYLRFCIAGRIETPNAPLIPQDNDILGTIWLSYQEVKRATDRLRSPLVLQCIEDYQQGHRYPLELYRDVC